MSNEYRSRNGRMGAGVPKNFSDEERRLRAERVRKVQHLAVAAVKRKARERLEQKAELKRTIKSAAEAGVFVPVQEWE